MSPELDYATLTLAKGAHRNREEGGCVMEWVSYLAGEPWSDTPDCVAPSIRSFCVSWNDALPDADRTRLLVPFIPKVIGTNTGDPAHELERYWLLVDWQARVSAPAWLRCAGLHDDAAALEACAPIVDTTTAQAAQATLDAARTRAAAARDAARDAAWDAARDAAWDAAWDAAGDAARDAARDAAGDAAWAAARERLRPTVEALQVSASELLDRLCAVGQ